jgi:hypothetical protein
MEPEPESEESEEVAEPVDEAEVADPVESGVAEPVEAEVVDPVESEVAEPVESTVKELTVKEWKLKFDELGIDKPLKGGKKAYWAAHDKYLADCASNDGDEDDEDLEEDGPAYSEVSFEGQEYLEDENNGDLYDFNHVKIGKWNDDCDDIIWSSEVAKVAHECNKD